MYNAGFFESGYDIIGLFHEQDANTDITGDWVNLRDYERALVVLAKTGTEDVGTLGVQILQATNNAAGSSKEVSALYRYWYKQGTLTSQATWTSGVLTTADGVLGVGSAAPTGGTLVVATDTNTSPIILCVEVLSEYLDSVNNFDHITAFVEGDEVGNACLVSAWAILCNGNYKRAVPLSAIG